MHKQENKQKKCWVHPFYYECLSPSELYILIFDGDNYSTMVIDNHIILFEEDALSQWIDKNSILYDIEKELASDFDIDEALNVLNKSNNNISAKISN